MLSNKKVLITNDDGVFAEGIKHLVKEIYKYTKNIVVIAPKNDSSAISHSITLRDGMKLERIEPIYKDIETYSLSGKPADCVSVGIVYLKLCPDYVISGINNGLNMGIDILYSGTVAACFEANIHNIKSIAFSFSLFWRFFAFELTLAVCSAAVSVSPSFAPSGAFVP